MSGAWRWIRLPLSLGLLGTVLYFALRHGQILLDIRPQVLALNVALTVLVVFLNGMVLKWITHAFAKPLTIAEAALLASLGSLMNAAGGLPIGTALNLAILVRKHGFALTDLLIGKAIATVLSIASLALL